MPKIDPEALRQVVAAFEQYEQDFERAIDQKVYTQNTWDSTYRPCAQYFVEYLSGRWNPIDGRRRR